MYYLGSSKCTEALKSLDSVLVRKKTKQSPTASENLLLCCNPFLKTQKNTIVKIGSFPSEMIDWNSNGYCWQAYIVIKDNDY